MAQRNLCLRMRLAPGDTVVLTALARDLKRALPDAALYVDSHHNELWQGNPHCRTAGRIPPGSAVETVAVDYGRGLRRQNHETVHFLAWLHRDASAKLGLPIPVTEPRGDLHFAPDEEAPLVGGRYWVVAAGGKSDFRAKLWSPAAWQAVVDALAALGLGVVRVGASGASNGVRHLQPDLRGGVDLVGRTPLRDLMRIVRDADGVLCGVSLPMHLAAALERPCVVVAGGREAWWWEAYVRENRGFGGAESRLAAPHRYLHTIGLLDCCRSHGCWRRHMPPDGDDSSRCRRPAGDQPECLALVTPAAVVEAVASYYADGTLPPI